MLPPLPGLVQALAALVLMFGLVWYGRRALARGSLFSRRSAQMRVEDRIAIDLRNALVIVRVEERRLLLALSDHGPAQLITELTLEQQGALAEASRRRRGSEPEPGIQ